MGGFDDMAYASSQRDLAQKVKDYIDSRMAEVRAGKTGAQFNGVSDADLMLELMARGYAVWRPREGE